MQNSALIGRAILDNVGAFKAKYRTVLGPIIVKIGNHAGHRLQKSEMKSEESSESVLRSVNRERDDVRDLPRSCRQHHEPIDAERDACAVGEPVIESGQQVLVDRNL